MKGLSNILTVLDATNGAEWIAPVRLPRLRRIYASPVGANGRVYLFDRDGRAVVLRHGREFAVLAENQLDDGIDATPALVGRRMYVRSRHFLYCLEEGAGISTTEE